MLTHQYVHRLFDYDPLTGVLVWRIKAAKWMRVGARAGTAKPIGRYVSIGNKLYMESHIIWLWMTGALPAHDIDHIDVNPCNNVWTNLREATDSENQVNQPNNRPGRLKWTTYDTDRKQYRARVAWQGKEHYVGRYDTELEAHNAAYAVAQQLHGQFVRR